MTRQSIQKIQNLKRAVLEYLGTNGRYYGELSRIEQSVEDLAQALNTRLDQLMIALEDGGEKIHREETPRDRLASRFMETASRLLSSGRVDNETANEFERALDMFDVSADLKRQSETARDVAETSALKHKMSRS
ncbi:hypothetical protein DSCW_18310 [Desulfosarcina widdelii]|uniref:Uncharacterized protein n=1 Tax=Desulfosarcina widdelii TaxID=947919 RepID=A0A5K7Z7G1_9BACT|nr:hypothetical protein [Desulfosarcina widdelii]BBO74414.1 hypothetical protein DSCW_18310 [Desulfosarcina widdelii]